MRAEVLHDDGRHAQVAVFDINLLDPGHIQREHVRRVICGALGRSVGEISWQSGDKRRTVFFVYHRLQPGPTQ